MMRSLSGFATLPFVLTCPLVGCAPAAEPLDELAGDSVNLDALDGKAGGAMDGASTYFELTTDLRKCPSPLCGGWFVERLNRTMMTCHDGTQAEVCYTPAFDWSEAKLPEEQRAELLDASLKNAVVGGVHAIVRGRFAPTNSTTPRPDMGALVVAEAWVAEGEAVSDGVFVRVTDNGLRCFAAPCPSLTETVLNTPQVANIAEVDFTAAGLSALEIEQCLDEMATPEGILVAGYRYMVHEEGGAAKARAATAAYRRLADVAEDAAEDAAR
jgi:hypothetical protein